MMIYSKRLIALIFLLVQERVSCFVSPLQPLARAPYCSSSSKLAVKNDNNDDNDDADDSWIEGLLLAKNAPDEALTEKRKLSGLKQKSNKKRNPKLTANAKLLQWLEEEGEVYLKDESGWGIPPHPLAISIQTKDSATNESCGRGLVARREIREGEEMIKIPLKLCITKESARETLGEDALPANTNEYLAIACQLIHEKYVMGDKSKYAPYIGVLPEVKDVRPTFAWPPSDLAFLEGSPLVAATRSMQLKLEREYQALFMGPDGLFAKFPDRFPKEHFTFNAWVWAFTNLFSRAIRLRNLKNGEALAMVPYADLMNHSPFSTLFVDAQISRNWIIPNGEEEVALYAERNYDCMDQIFISYGQKSNADLLLLYGFAVESNPYNSVDVTVGIAPRTESFVKEIAEDESMEVDPLAEEKLVFLERSGRSSIVDFPCYADRYPLEMLQYLRLMCMTPEDTRGKPLRVFDYSRPISLANEAAALSSVVTAIRRQLSKYAQTEQEDIALIKDRNRFKLLTRNQRMAVRHRRIEKRLLKRTVSALEKQMQRQGLDGENLERAGGNTLGQALPGDEERRYGGRPKTALEDRLERMGLPVEIK